MLKIIDKKKFIQSISALMITLGLVIVLIIGIVFLFSKPKERQVSQDKKEEENTIDAFSQSVDTNQNEELLSQWNLKLVNKNNSVDKSYIPELVEIDDGRMFDKRAISYLKDMISAIRKKGITNIWVQSSYRSYEKQEQLFLNKVEQYKKKGKKQEEAESLAQTIVQRPEMSEHNLGLAVDFNNVTNDFEKTKAFTWLQENAANYGFILRYPKDKQDITGITYESWHWRYVGEEHAKVMKEKNYCLEEYIDYLKGTKEI